MGKRAPTRLVPNIVVVRLPEVDPAACIVDGKEGLARCMVGQPDSCWLRVMGMDGHPRPDAEVSLSCSEPGQLELEVVDEGSGCYRIDFTPIQSGGGFLHVRVNGHEVGCSPLACNVGHLVKASSQRDV